MSPPTTSGSLLVDVRNSIAFVTLNRPERLNALDAELRSAIATAFDEFHLDDDVRVVVLTGAGTRAFCSGVDLKETEEIPATALLPHRGEGRNVFEAVLECGKPVLAAINGWALGAGCELALACDIRIAARNTRLGMPEAKRGLGGNFGAQMLARAVPIAIAYEMLYLGDDIDAQRGFEIGLLNRVVADQELARTAEELAQRIASNAPLTVQHHKAAVGRGRDLPISAALRLEIGPNPYLSEDRVEGARAFAEKRPPIWQGR